MKIIEASVKEQNLIIKPSVISVAESVGAYALKITYDEQWENIDTKVVTFTAANGISIGIHDNDEENGVAIPWEVVQCPGKVTVGVVGYAGTELKLTTTGLYDRNTFVVLPSAFGLSTAITPTPDIYQSLLQTLKETNAKIGDLNNLETEVKDNLVAAINEVLGGGGAGTVKSVNSIEPDAEGNVELNPTNIGAASSGELIAEINDREASDIALGIEISTKQDVLTQTQLSAVNSGIDSPKVGQIATNTSNISANADAISTINGKIPSATTSENQLADKNFVNSSVSTNTAYYISDNGQPFTSLADLEAYSGTLTNNDYAFVVGTDQAGNTTYTRYKYNADTQTWAEEYVLNNSSFTSDQWAAISSGITSSGVAKLNGIEAGAEVNEIDSISVNGTAVTPDANKNVDISIPEGVLLLDVDNHTLTADELQAFKDAWDSREPIFIHYGAVGGQIVHPLVGNTLDWTRTQTFSAIMGIGVQEGYDDKGNPGFQGGVVTFTPSTMNLSLAWNTSSSLVMEGESSLSTLTGSDNWVKKSAIRKALATKADNTAFTGTDGTTAGEAGLVPAPVATDVGKFLKADGTWDEAGTPINVVQTTGTSTTDVMSQNAVTGMVFADPGTNSKVVIGGGTSGMPGVGTNAVRIGAYAGASGSNAIAISSSSSKEQSNGTLATGSGAIAMGAGAQARGNNSFAFGYGKTGSDGQISFGADLSGNTTKGVVSFAIASGNSYASSGLRVLRGVYDPVLSQDVATKNYVDRKIINGDTTAPTTSTVGAVGTQYTYVDTTGTPTAHLCVCTEVDTTDPSNPVYTWQTLI